MHKSVWLVDDMMAINLINKHVIQKVAEGTDVKIYSNTDNFIEAIQDNIQELPSMIFLDLNMPKNDGWEILEMIEEKFEQFNIPIYVLSTSINPDDVSKAKEHKLVKEFISKPLQIQEVERIFHSS